MTDANELPQAADEREIRALLKSALPPASAELPRDLWPQMQTRLSTHATTIPWFDWALAATVACFLIFHPSTITLLLYHL